MKNEKKINQLPITSYTLTATAQAKIDNVLAYFISTNMMPYSIVKKDGFKMYTNALNASYKIPSRKTMTESRIPHLYKMTKDNVESIAKNTLFMSFTTDCWTSVANQPFMALTGHYIDTDFNLGMYKNQTTYYFNHFHAMKYFISFFYVILLKKKKISLYLRDSKLLIFAKII